MAKYYEVVIFTAAMQEYADWILDRLDENKSISHRLYRQHTAQEGSFFLKDLNMIGRELSRTIIVDNVAENFQRTPDNGIFIRTWMDDPDDCALIELCPILASNRLFGKTFSLFWCFVAVLRVDMVINEVEDVRDSLRKLRDQMIEHIQERGFRSIQTETKTLR